jgi:hypothetical protein
MYVQHERVGAGRSSVSIEYIAYMESIDLFWFVSTCLFAECRMPDEAGCGGRYILL